VSAVIELQPRDESYIKRATKLLNAGELDKAYAIVDEVLRKNPDDAQALVLASDLLKKAKRLPIAYVLAKRASELRADRPEVWSAVGHAAQRLWRLDEAEASYRKAFQRAKTPEQKTLYLSNLGSVLLDAGQFEKAEQPCREALKIDPKDTNARHNLGLSLLAQRRWQEGWPYYSASVGGEQRKLVKYKNPGEPVWDGAKDKIVCVYGEQGLGDEICAASMLPDVIRDSRKTIIDCDHRLENLFRRSFPQTSVHGTRWKPGDWKGEALTIEASIAGFEVGKFYRNTDSDFPGTPYLTPCPDRTAMWKSRWANSRKPVIGIAWTGGIWQNASLYRELKLPEWQPIFDAVNANWVCLQYKDAGKEIEGTPVRQYQWATLTPDYDDTAALVASCDLVIAMQTTVVHLAGALGIPCWSMIPKTSQWRYGETCTDLPWYRSVKLYRQKDSWAPVVKKIAEDVHAHFA
jgi:tetratricopeptide (TPR) repeat protein